MTDDYLVDEIMEAQADIQIALGFLRLELRPEYRSGSIQALDKRLLMIENRMARSLARMHRLLKDLDSPMYSPATHPEIGPNDEKTQATETSAHS